MKTCFILTLLYFCFYYHSGAIAQASSSARSLALANGGYTFQNSDAVFTNQAGLVFSHGFAAGLSAEKVFALEDHVRLNAGISYANETYGAFGFRLQRYGNDIYNETSVSMSYARHLAEILAASVSFEYSQTAIEKYLPRSGISFQLGLLANFGNQIGLGFHLTHAVEKQHVGEAARPHQMNLEFGYRPNHQLHILAGIRKDILYSPAISVAVDYAWQPYLSLYTGFLSNPSTFSLGIGVKQKRYRIDIAISQHWILGISPAIGISFG